MKILFYFAQIKINLGILLFIIILLKPFSSVAAFSFKNLDNSYNLSSDNYVISLRYVPTTSINQHDINELNSFSKALNQTENNNVFNFLENSQAKRTELSDNLNQLASQLSLIEKISYQQKDAVDNVGSLRSFYTLPTVASVVAWQGNLVQGLVVTVPMSSYALPIQDFHVPFRGWDNTLPVTNNLIQEIERFKPLSNNFQNFKLSERTNNSSSLSVVPILPQVAYKNIYKGIYDFDITIVDEPERKYNFIVN